jgi:2-keto-4-pentenoate hydratase/2-oxohepta-3-ene-1,7-dioic acid hydratase in catechol pathway
MRIARFLHEGEARYGRLDGDVVVVLQGNPIRDGAIETGETLAAGRARLLPPVEPSATIIGIGMNYPPRPDGPQLPLPDEPKMFLKATASAIAPGQAIELPPVDGEVIHEGELAVVIGRTVKRVSREDALDAVFGYTIANDVTARDQMLKDGLWARAKSYDTFCPLGPAIDTEIDPAGAEIATYVNGELRSSGNTSDLLFDVAHLVSHVSHVFTLQPGDVILTGAPGGTRTIVPGDDVEIVISGLGTLQSPVIARP